MEPTACFNRKTPVGNKGPQATSTDAEEQQPAVRKPEARAQAMTMVWSAAMVRVGPWRSAAIISWTEYGGAIGIPRAGSGGL